MMHFAQRVTRQFSAVLLLGAACDGSPEAPAFTVRDSAGVEIVESASPFWETPWTVTPEPFIDIGTTEGADPYLLDRVMGVVRLDDGGVVVANMGDNTLRYFDAAGTFVTRAGGSGGGPEEFFQIMAMERVGDELFVLQFSVRPNKVFDQHGEFVRAVPTPRVSDGPTVRVRGVFDDGTLLMADFPQGDRSKTGVWLEYSTYYHADAERVDSILSLPAVYYVDVGRFPTGQELGPVGGGTVRGNHFYFGWTADYDIRVFDSEGELRRRIRRAWEPLPVTDEDKARYLDFMVNGRAEGGGPLPARLREQRRGIADNMVFPEHHPAHRRMIVDRTDHLWVERTMPNDDRRYQRSFRTVSSRPTIWDVFDPSGVWLGAVQLPMRFSVMEIGDDYMAGVWKDEADVEHVRVHELVKPDG